MVGQAQSKAQTGGKKVSSSEKRVRKEGGDAKYNRRTKGAMIVTLEESRWKTNSTQVGQEEESSMKLTRPRWKATTAK